jgi:hypothetical protein
VRQGEINALCLPGFSNSFGEEFCGLHLLCLWIPDTAMSGQRRCVKWAQRAHDVRKTLKDPVCGVFPILLFPGVLETSTTGQANV